MNADELAAKLVETATTNVPLGSSGYTKVRVVNPNGDILEISEVTFSLIDGGMIQLHVIDPDSDD